MVRDSDSNKKEGTKKESALKKFLKKRSFIYLLCTVVFVVFFVPDMIPSDDLEKKIILNLESDGQKDAWQFVKSYQGKDDNGSNLYDIILTQIKNAYPTENILKHNDTILKISVADIQKQNNVGFYEVNFTFQTYDKIREYIWNVNIVTEEIIPVNTGARKMLNIVDNYD
jgi:hypothetical protein|tara:strand:+ start:3595 stop:4104 length:510 start_codon:yes stop_codon:yes gene_type:complete